MIFVKRRQSYKTNQNKQADDTQQANNKMTSTMEFDCKLAHCDEIKRISNFNSIKDLYDRVGQTFGLQTTSDILYCTLNTHNFRDMNALLGNYLSFGDLIIVHLCGSVKELTIKKTHEFLGLTITDNANGRAFVKKVNSNDLNVNENIKPGDHIAAINSESTIGLRHYEVAKAIRLLPLHTNFTIRLIEPNHDADKYLQSDILDRENNIYSVNANTIANGGINSVMNKINQQRHELSDTVSLGSTCDDLINSSLPIDKLLSKSNNGTNNNNNNNNRQLDLISSGRQESGSYKSTIDKINAHLESFLGINDNLLAIKIYRLARENKHSFSLFESAIAKSELRVFNFDDEMKNYLWNCAMDLTM